MGHPEVPWPLYDRLTSPKGGGGTRPRGKVERLFPSTVHVPGPISPTTLFIWRENEEEKRVYIGECIICSKTHTTTHS